MKTVKSKICHGRKSQLLVSSQVIANPWCGLAVTFCGFILNLIGRETINFPEIFSGVHGFMGKTAITLCCRYVDHIFTTSYLRELPELAKQFVMRTLFADQPIPETLVAAWVKTEHQKYDIMLIHLYWSFNL